MNRTNRSFDGPPSQTEPEKSLSFAGPTWTQGGITITAVRPTLDVTSLGSQIDLASAYTKLKLGHYGEITRAASDVVRALPSQMCHGIARNPKEWCVLSTGTHQGFGLPSAALIIARECSTRLQIPHITYTLAGSDRSRVSSTRYEDLPTKEERISVLQQEISKADLSQLLGMNVVLCDDSIVSGTFIELVTACAKQHGAKEVFPFVLHRFDGHGNHSFEQRVNASGFIHNPIPIFTALLADRQTSMTTRLIAYCLSLPAERLRTILTTIPEHGLLNILAAGLVFYGTNLPEGARSIFSELEPDIMGAVGFDAYFSEQCKRRIGHLLTAREWRNTSLARETLVTILHEISEQ
jgi:hypothetical protein